MGTIQGTVTYTCGSEEQTVLNEKIQLKELALQAQRKDGTYFLINIQFSPWVLTTASQERLKEFTGAVSDAVSLLSELDEQVCQRVGEAALNFMGRNDAGLHGTITITCDEENVITLLTPFQINDLNFIAVDKAGERVPVFIAFDSPLIAAGSTARITEMTLACDEALAVFLDSEHVAAGERLAAITLLLTGRCIDEIGRTCDE